MRAAPAGGLWLLGTNIRADGAATAPASAPVSWPGLARPSTTCGAGRGKVVDGRAKPGHDTVGTAFARRDEGAAAFAIHDEGAAAFAIHDGGRGYDGGPAHDGMGADLA